MNEITANAPGPDAACAGCGAPAVRYCDVSVPVVYEVQVGVRGCGAPLCAGCCHVSRHEHRPATKGGE